MNELALILMQWIAAHSDYPAEGVPMPEIVAMTPAELTAEFYAEAGLAPAQRPDVDPRIMALYDRERGNGTIYIIAPELTEGQIEGEDPTANPVFQERLLHELVHHLQARSGAYEQFQCTAQGEADAYRLGGAWLKAHRLDDPLPNRAFWAKMYSLC